MKKTSLLFLMFLALVASAAGTSLSAGSVIVSKSYGTSANTWPFTSSSLFKIQFVIDKAELDGQVGDIISYGHDFGTSVNKTYPNIKIFMGETAKTSSTQSNTFDSNFEISGKKLVKDSAWSFTTGTTTAPNFIRMPFDTPFEYTGTGNLTVELQITQAPNVSTSVTSRYGSVSPYYRLYQSGGYTSTSGTKSGFYRYNFSVEISQGEELTWTGATSSDWNTASNWSGATPAKVPEADDTVTIPAAAGLTNLPQTGASSVAGDVVLKAGSVLNLGASDFTVSGDWTNEGGTVNFGAGDLDFAGSGKAIDNGGSYFQNMTISGSNIRWMGNFTPGGGALTIDANSRFTVDSGNVDFSGVALTNNGGLGFKADGDTTATTMSVTLPAGTISDVYYEATDTTDTININTASTYTTFEMSGAGAFNFPGSAITVTDDFKSTTSGTRSLTINGTADCDFADTGTNDYFNATVTAALGDITHTGIGRARIYGVLQNSNVTQATTGRYLYLETRMMGGTFTNSTNYTTYFNDGIDSTGDFHLYGSGSVFVYDFFRVRNLRQTSSGGLYSYVSGTHTVTGYAYMAPTSTGTNNNFYSSGMTISSYLQVDGPGASSGDFIDMGGDLNVGLWAYIYDGTVSLDGNLNCDDLRILNNGALNINGFGQSETDDIEIDGPGTLKLKCNGSLIARGELTTDLNASVEIGGNLEVYGDLDHQGLGGFTVDGDLLIDGSTSAGTLVLTTGGLMTFGTLKLDIGRSINITGEFESTSGNALSPSISIEAGTAAIFNDGNEFALGANAFINIAGSLTVNTLVLVDAPEFIGATVAADRATLMVRSTASLSFNGLRFTNFGASDELAGLTIEDGATITRFSNVSVTDSAATAAIDINTSNVVEDWDNFFLSGTSATSIDATGVTTNIEVTIDTNGGGNLFDGDKEIDPNLRVFWNTTHFIQFLSLTDLGKAYTGEAYSKYIANTGGNPPYRFVKTAGPAWLSINELTGEMTGTPGLGDIVVDTNVTIEVNDVRVAVPAVSKSFTLTIEEPPYFAIDIVTPGILPDAQADSPYTYFIVATKGLGAHVFALTDEPSWLTIDSASGVISGTPPLLFSGTVEFKVEVTDIKALPPVVKDFGFTVNPSGYVAIEINDLDVPEAHPERAFSHKFTAINGLPAYNFALVNAPTWLSVDNTGLMTGTPPVSELGNSYQVTVEVRDTKVNAPVVSHTFGINVTPVPYSPVNFITLPLLPAGNAGIAYTTTIQIINGTAPFTFSLTNAPSWMSIHAISGVITGTPPSSFAGVLNLAVRVQDSEPGKAAVTRNFAMEVAPDLTLPPVFSTSSVLLKSSTGTAYNMTLGVYGRDSAELTWVLVNGTALPTGLSLDSDTGVISGTPAAGLLGVFNFDIQATDENNNSSEQSFTLEIVEVIDDTPVFVPGGDTVDRIPSGSCSLDGDTSGLPLIIVTILAMGAFALRRRQTRLS